MIREALGLFPSVIKSGENWSPKCQEVLEAALRELQELEARKSPLLPGCRVKLLSDITDSNGSTWANKGTYAKVDQVGIERSAIHHDDGSYLLVKNIHLEPL